MYSEEVRELLAEFNLQADPNDPDSMRGAILSLIASLHPDKTGGSFANEAQKKKFEQVLRLRTLFDGEIFVSTQMVPIQQVVSLIEVIAKAQALARVEDQQKISQTMAPEQFRRSLKRKYAFPKITSALIATLCFALFTFLGNFKNSPFYRIVLNAFANSNKVIIINYINDVGGTIKLRESRILLIDQYNWITNYDDNKINLFAKLTRGELIGNKDDWPETALMFGNTFGTSVWLGSVTAIADVDLYSSDEAELFRTIEKLNIQIDKAVSPGIDALTAELKIDARNKPRVKSRYVMPSGDSLDGDELQAAYKLLINIKREGRTVNQKISEIREWLQKAKPRALEAAERRILILLAIVTIIGCSTFVVFWLRERSDQRWVEFVSSDEGLELVFSRLRADKGIASRTPPKFQLSEFTQIVAKKDVPQYLAPALGEHLDAKELRQVASSLIARLKETKVINQVKAPTIQQWFEIAAVDFTDADTAQGGSLHKGASINVPEG